MIFSKLVIVLSILFSLNSWANDYEAIDVNGSYSNQGSTSKLEQMRRRLEKRNEIMVRKQIETIRYQNELKLMRETEKKMNEMMKQI